jgi:UDP-GlcNAc:undecaprenyl-phosphate/decaprenyl-phosphate GlcNAc-1-phosphate transferase
MTSLAFILGDWQSVLLAFVSSVCITLYAIPSVIKTSSLLHFTDRPGLRKVHKIEIPTLGGIGIAGGFIFGFLLTIDGKMEGVTSLIMSLLLLFFLGIKDDVMGLDPKKKFTAEIFACAIVTIFGGMYLSNFHGFMGITAIPKWSSYMLTIALAVIILNSVNLIDGIDGLAASTSLIATSVMGAWFWFSGDIGYAIMASALSGALVVFLFFNFSKGKYKIFMGDSGALVIGFLLAIMVIRFNEINLTSHAAYKLLSSPSISIAIIIVPLFDTMRVFIVRIINGEKPFVGDNRHIHHLMLRAGYSHKQTTLRISIAHAAIIGIAFMFDHLGIFWLSMLLFIICLSLTGLVVVLIKHNQKTMPSAVNFGHRKTGLIYAFLPNFETPKFLND